MRPLFYTLVLCLGLTASQSASAQHKAGNKAIEPILTDWKHRQGLLRSARYVVSGTTEFHDREVPPGDSVRPERSVLILDLERKRYRLETSKDIISNRGGGQLTWMQRLNTSAYDGKEAGTLTHKEANRIGDDVGDLVISKGDRAGSEFEAELWPILFGHGLIPTVHTNIQFKKLPPAYDAEGFEVCGQQLLDERECTVLRTEPKAFMRPLFNELWVDRTQASGVRRYIEFSGSNPWIRLDVNWKKHPSGWFPQDWRLTWTREGELWRIHRLQITVFEPNPAVQDADFTLDVKPGMRIDVVENPPMGRGLDPRYQAVRKYLVSASGAWQEIDAKGFRTFEGKQLAPERSMAWPYWSLAGLLGLGAGAYFVLYRNRKARV